MTYLLTDLRAAARSLRRLPGFTAITLATLALGVGEGIGLLASSGLASILGSALYGIGELVAPTDLAAASVVLLGALVATWIPAAQTASVEPVRALRSE